jgi:starvation-inducible outer membrane lipoprotein
MKKIALILSLVLMLAACGAQPAETTAPAAATAPRAPVPSWLRSCTRMFPSSWL